MGSRGTHFKYRVIPISQQIGSMEYLFPQFKKKWKDNYVEWVGDVKPTELSEIYTVKIKYSLGMVQPEVTVISPSLTKRENGEEIPHVYKGNKLCLFRPKKKEWTKKMLISKTLIPWISLWLYYYEMWHVTGAWLGGGEHPNE